MKSNNSDGVYDSALAHQIPVLKYFYKGSAYREELPEEEDHAAAAA